jgi:L-iditol 2-dehydrogenase
MALSVAAHDRRPRRAAVGGHLGEPSGGDRHRFAGAAWVDLADVHPSRLTAARDFDVDDVIDARDAVDYASFRPEVLLECTRSSSVVSAGIRAPQPLGRAVLVGMGTSAEQSLPVQAIQNHELSVTGTFRYAHTYPDAIALAAAGRIDLDAIVGPRLPLADTERALTMGRTDPAILKTVVAVQD